MLSILQTVIKALIDYWMKIKDINSIKNGFSFIKIAQKSNISKEKVKDIKSLLRYVSPENREFYNNFLSQFE